MLNLQSPDHPSTVDALIDFLSWERDDMELLRIACNAHIRWSFWRLFTLAERTSEPRLFDEIRALPLPRQQRILLSPVVHHLMGRDSDEEALRSVRSFISMERSDADATVEMSGWTALGDYYRGPDGAEYRAKTVGHLVLDTNCDHNGGMHPPIVKQLIPHSVAEVECIQAGLGSALAEIRATSLSVNAMLSECTRIIRISKAPDSPEINISYSHRDVIGRIGFVNAHNSKSWPLARFVNDLVHESVHAMIYKIELITPLYVDYKLATDMSVRSPWSGRELNLHSFVHACFVWYALWCFWRRVARLTSEMLEKLERARDGFLTGDLLAPLHEPVRANIQPYVRDAIARAAARVRTFESISEARRV